MKATLNINKTPINKSFRNYSNRPTSSLAEEN